jgi:outer membrane receptor protein involved in Fe transport
MRYSDMTFLQHFLPGQPLEENGQTSAGIMAMAIVENEQRTLTMGLDVEWSDSYLKETQDGPADGSAFIQATRPAGKHYDYAATAMNLAAYVQAEIALNHRLHLSAGLRAEHMRYRYDNRMLDGNTTDTGTVCDFGGCLYTRPADRNDNFNDLAPRVALSYAVTAQNRLYVNAGQGFRAPQMTELYRLQSGQAIADLDSERLDSIELGWRSAHEHWSIDTSLFAMRKKNSVLRDADGYNVDDGRSKHAGLEWRVDANLSDSWQVSFNGSYAKHTYDFDSVAALGETFVSGRDVDTAPRWLASAELYFTPGQRLQVALQWNTIGEYYLDAENRYTYPGHELWNLRTSLQLGKAFTATFRLNNLLDEDVADRADYAFGNYRYFPGRGRELFIELSYAAGTRR